MKRIATIIVACVFAGSLWAANQQTITPVPTDPGGTYGPGAGSGIGEGRVYQQGDKWVQEINGTLGNARAVKLDIAVGNVKITGADQPNVTYVIRKSMYASGEPEARKQFSMFRVSAGMSGDTAVFRGECYQPMGQRKIQADFEITVPRDLVLVQSKTENGAVAVRSVKGKVIVETGGGRIDLDDLGGSVVAETEGGSINLGTAAGAVVLRSQGGNVTAREVGGTLVIESQGGRIEVGNAHAAVNLQTAGGDIHVTSTGGDLIAETAGGNVDIGDIGGKASLRTAGGNIRVNSAKGPVQAETAGGAIRLMRLSYWATGETAGGNIVAEFVGTGQDFRDSRFETTAGDVVVYLPSNLAVTVHANVEIGQGHNIVTDFPDLKITTEGGEYGAPREVSADGNLNGGGPQLRVATTVGNIELRRTSKK